MLSQPKLVYNVSSQMNHGMRNPSWQLEYENNVSVSSQQTSMLVPDGASDTYPKTSRMVLSTTPHRLPTAN